MKSVVVTGATSMIGVSIIRECIEQNVANVYAVVRPNSSKLNRLPKEPRINVIECDVNQYAMLPTLISEKCDVFYHIAWSVTGAARNQNIYGQALNIQYTLDAVNAAAALGCTKFIGAGSQAEYGKLDMEKIGITAPTNPIQPYGIAKYAAGKLALEEAKRLGIDCIWVRIFSVYGLYDKETSMISSSIKKMKAGERVSYTEGIQLWDYLYSEDAGKAFYLIGEKSVGNKVYCLGSGEARLLREYIIEMRDAINPRLSLGLGDIPYTEGNVMNLCADIAELNKDTGWLPEVSFAEGIERIINFSKVGL